VTKHLKILGIWLVGTSNVTSELQREPVLTNARN
jgi:hypothetical protein